MSNSDKKLQDKLQQFSAPADPQAWETMQAMLEKKDRPKFAFWWWTSGIAASAVIAIGLLLTLAAGESRKTAIALSANQQITSNSQDAGSISTTASSEIGNKNLPRNNPASSISSLDENALTTTGTSHTDKASNSVSSSPALNQSSEEDALAIALQQKAKSKNSRKNKGYRGPNQTHTQKPTPAVYSNSFAQITSTVQQAAATDIPTTAHNSTPSDEAIFIDRIALGLLSVDRPDSDISKTEDAEKPFLKKSGKTRFSYSIGAQTTLLATLTGNTFHTLPSHQSGLMQWFGVGKYFALNLGLTAGQISFAASDSFGPAYSLTALFIPVGIQLNPVSKGRITWIVNTGVSNNFVLQQSVALNYPPYQQQDGTNSTPDPTVNFGNLTTVKATALEKSIHKYHLSFYASTGIEVAIRRKISFYSGATFSLPITPISSEKPKILQLGGVAGFRFRLL